MSPIYSLLELAITVCFCVIAVINFSPAHNGKYSVILVVGALGAAVANAVYIIMLLLYHTSNIIPELGNTSQLILLCTVLLVGICSNRIPCSYTIIVGTLVFPVILGGGVEILRILREVTIIFPTFSVFGINIYHPYYLYLAIGWILGGIISFNRWKYIFPPYSGLMFFIYVITANILVALLSPNTVELYSAVALALELAGLYTIIIMYLINNYQLKNAYYTTISDRRKTVRTTKHIPPDIGIVPWHQ